MNHRYDMFHPDCLKVALILSVMIIMFLGLNTLSNMSSTSTLKDVIYPADKQINIPPIRFGITWGFYTLYTIV